MSLKIIQREIELDTGIKEVPEKYLPLLSNIYDAIDEVDDLLCKAEKLMARLEIIQEQAEDIVMHESFSPENREFTA